MSRTMPSKANTSAPACTRPDPAAARPTRSPRDAAPDGSQGATGTARWARMARPRTDSHRFSDISASAACKLKRPQAALDFAPSAPRRSLAGVLIGVAGGAGAWGVRRLNRAACVSFLLETSPLAERRPSTSSRGVLQLGSLGRHGTGNANFGRAGAVGRTWGIRIRVRQERAARRGGCEVERSLRSVQLARRRNRGVREATRLGARASHSHPPRRADRGL